MKEYIDKHEVYDTLANKLTWLMSLGDEVYLSVGNEIRNVLNEQPTTTEAEIRAKAIDDVIPVIVEELETDSSVKLYGSGNSDNYLIPVKRVIEIVKQGGVSDD